MPSLFSTPADDVATLLEEALMLSCAGHGRQEVSYGSPIKV